MRLRLRGVCITKAELMSRWTDVSIIISDEIVEAFQLTQPEFLQEIALYLFQSERLTLGYAAQMDRLSFEVLLKACQIPLYIYDVEDFELDIQGLQALGRL